MEEKIKRVSKDDFYRILDGTLTLKDHVISPNGKDYILVKNIYVNAKILLNDEVRLSKYHLIFENVTIVHGLEINGLEVTGIKLKKFTTTKLRILECVNIVKIAIDNNSLFESIDIISSFMSEIFLGDINVGNVEIKGVVVERLWFYSATNCYSLSLQESVVKGFFRYKSKAENVLTIDIEWCQVTDVLFEGILSSVNIYNSKVDNLEAISLVVEKFFNIDSTKFIDYNILASSKIHSLDISDSILSGEVIFEDSEIDQFYSVNSTWGVFEIQGVDYNKFDIAGGKIETLTIYPTVAVKENFSISGNAVFSEEDDHLQRGAVLKLNESEYLEYIEIENLYLMHDFTGKKNIIEYLVCNNLILFGINIITNFSMSSITLSNFRLLEVIVANDAIFRINYLSSIGPGHTIMDVADSDLGDSVLFNIRFDTFDVLNIVNSKLSNITAVNVVWHPNITSDDHEKGMMGSNLRLSETYSQLKLAMSKQQNRIQELEFYAKEMETYGKTLGFKFWKEKWWIFWSNKISNKHGLSWTRALACILVVAEWLYLPFVLESENYEQQASVLPHFFEFILPIHKLDFLPYEIPWYLYLADFSARIIIGYLIYQMIRAFRRYAMK